MSQHDLHIDPDIEAFKGEVEAFLCLTQMRHSRFGREARNDSRFVVDLRNGRMPDYQTRLHVRDWMTGYLVNNGFAPTNDADLDLRSAG